jgi:hypothetical protein
MRPRPIAALGALVVCASLLATPATAKKRTTKTRIEPLSIIKDNETQYLISGRLIAKTARCRFQRTVSLHVIHADSTDTVVLSTKTNSGTGAFHFRAALAAGEGVYVTTSAKNFVIKSGTKVHCGTGRSIPQYPT